MAKIRLPRGDDHRYTRIVAGGKGMTNRCLLGAGVALAVAFGGVQAHAQAYNPGGIFPVGAPGAWNNGPEGGWTSLINSNNSISPVHFTGPTGGTFSTPGLGNVSPNFNSGFNVGARGGYQWGPWRFEEEYSYRNNQLSSLNLNQFGFTTNGSRGQGQTTSNAIMTNVIYDFTV